MVEDEWAVERVTAVTERIIGDLEGPHAGILFVVPVSRVLEIKRKGQEGT